eukprot:6477639-Amphidinium_carterae.2
MYSVIITAVFRDVGAEAQRRLNRARSQPSDQYPGLAPYAPFAGSSRAQQSATAGQGCSKPHAKSDLPTVETPDEVNLLCHVNRAGQASQKVSCGELSCGPAGQCTLYRLSEQVVIGASASLKSAGFRSPPLYLDELHLRQIEAGWQVKDLRTRALTHCIDCKRLEKRAAKLAILSIIDKQATANTLHEDNHCS